jgi:hypothetical protein
MSTNLHALFGLTADAHPDVIKAAYRALAKQYHPDGAGTGNPERLMISGKDDQTQMYLKFICETSRYVSCFGINRETKTPCKSRLP